MGQVLFVIGFPRSGTKLLLQLLRTHTAISGAGVEVNLAHLINANTTDEQFREMLMGSTLWDNVNETTRASLERFLKENSIGASASIEDFYTDIVRACDDGNSSSNYVVDKSPRYITRANQLMKTFPNAKFIHIVREVKSVANSHHKVWGKNIYRVADQWNKSLTSFYKQSRNAACVLELKYEDLARQPEVQCKRIADFLGVDNSFDLKNVSSNEVHGKAVTKGIVENKDAEEFTGKQKSKIEAIAFNGLSSYAYPITFATSSRNLPLRARLLFFAQDHLNLLRFHIKEKGLLKGSQYYIRLIR